MAKITVITPTHRRPDLLFQCIKAVQKSTFTDYEHIVIGDSCPWAKRVCELFIDDTRIKYHSKNYTNCNLIHQSNLSGSELFVYALRWIFFTEDDSLNMNLTSPWFTNSPHMKYGSIIPGQFDVGKWFRSITLEYNLWPDNNEFKILADEIAGYVSFETPNDVELVRFQMNEPLTKYSRSTATSSSWYTNVPLLKRYKMFENSKMKRLIMKEIKKCII